MVALAEVFSAFNITELLRVVWMEVALACMAATVYFTLTGWIPVPGKKDAPKAHRNPTGKVDIQETTEYQLVTKGLGQRCNWSKPLRPGQVSDAIALLKEMPETIAGCVPTKLAPRLLMAAAQSPDFDDVMAEMDVFVGKIEARSLDAVVQEAAKNKDVAACRRLQVMSSLLSIPKSTQAMEAFARGFASDAACLRTLVEEAEAPLSRLFAKVVLEACTTLKDVDLSLDVFDKIADCDAGYLRSVVEKAATSPTTDTACTKDIALHAKEIRACGKNKDIKGALNIFEQNCKHSTNGLLFNSIIDACVESGNQDKAMEFLNQAKAGGFADVITYNTAMKGFLSQGQIAAAKCVFAEISEKGLSPTLASYHGLLNFHVNAGDRSNAWKIMADMQSAGVSPTAITCSILLKGNLNSADVSKVLALVDTIEPMDEVLFSALADACIRTRQLPLLAKYQAKLSSKGTSLALAAPTYGSMIKAYGQARDVKHVKELWGEMTHHGVQPTAITLGCMVEALVMNRCTTEAWKLVQQMRSEEATKELVNTVIYSTIMKGFAYGKETDKVMALYEEMRTNGIQPNNITYNTILNAFAQGGVMDRVPALLEDMKNATPPADPDIVTYSTLVKGFCNSGGLDRALDIMKMMQEEGKLTPDEVMYNSLLDGCAKEQRPTEALKLLEVMKKNAVAPSNYTLSMLVKLMGRCRRLNQAFVIIDDISREYGLKVNIQVYTCLIQACFNNRQPAKAVALHDRILKEGLLPDEMTYSALVQGCLKAHLVDQAVHLAKCAHGAALPKVSGTPPGINARSRDELVNALGGQKGQALLAELAACQTGSAAPQGKGSSKGSSSNSAPWRR